MIFFLFILSLTLISLILCAKSTTTEEESFRASKSKHPKKPDPNVERTERISIHGSVEDNNADFTDNTHFALPEKKGSKESTETKDTKDTKDTRGKNETKHTKKEAKMKAEKESPEESDNKFSLSASMSYTQEEPTETAEKRHERKHRTRDSNNRSRREKHRRPKKLPLSSLSVDTTAANSIAAPLNSAIQPVSMVEKTQYTKSSIGTVTHVKADGNDGRACPNTTQEDTQG
ncbi:unnamed protein product [Bursaphelenchus xylophilus]|uniref:(pine wood nematode) hypothetical protein n=1 Tax=Bursaphelenchus xylophilus TaxID=6326 RepID=A0A1I7SGK4_BURXY|nr:unnamed protein product [Bursaphelenchus xylophilus]CAG9122464.1 unnamed protein product [Bursaphelenchus xylophilus]